MRTSSIKRQNGKTKKRMLITLGRFIALSLSLASCSMNLAGGTSTETTNGIIVLTSEGFPASGADVSVADGALWIDSIEQGKSPIVQQTSCDRSGYVRVEKTVGARTVRVIWGDQSAIVSGLSDTIRLAKTVPLSGTALGVDTVRIGGTDLISPVAFDGTFSFPEVPSGAVTLYAVENGEITGGMSVQTSDTTVSHYFVPPGNILFDDFNGGFDTPLLSPVTRGVSWYTFCDSVHQSYRSGAWMIDSFSSHDGTSMIVPTATGTSASLQFLLGSGTQYPYAGIGVHLGTADRGFNLSGISAVTMKIRGTGTVRFSLESNLHDSLGMGSFSCVIPIDSNWKTVRIPIDSLKPEPKDTTLAKSFPWQAGESDIRRMELFMRGTENTLNHLYTVEIDEIAFEGVDFPF